jgi:hypothetical protein
MRRVRDRRIIVGLLVGLLTTAAFVGLAAGPAAASPAPGPSPAAASVAYEFYDFFDVPFGEWWDYRTAIYGDLPVNAECFSAAGVANGVCTPSLSNVRDVPAYPYTNWYPSPGAIQPGEPDNNPFMYAPFRFRATGTDVAGYTLSDPVFLPVLNPAAAPGTRLDFDWRMQYLDTAETNALTAAGCAIDVSALDGFQIRSRVTLTMDLQESKRLFNVVGTTPTDAQNWWTANTNPNCFFRGTAETALQNWFLDLGGRVSTVGKYDIFNSFEWYYQPYVTQLAGTVQADGTTTVTIDHVAWGTEVVLARIFYWGATSYAQYHLDSTRAAGWWGMELAWFEDFSFAGSVASTNFDFTLSSVMQYQFWQNDLPGADGLLNRVGDVPYWSWGPVLSDYTNDASNSHLISELDRYPNPPYAYLHSAPGSPQYNRMASYDYVPVTWNLRAGDTWHFQFPTNDVVFYDPNLTPIGANPVAGQYVEIRRPLTYMSTRPASFGTWNEAAKTWDVAGPATTGGPVGSPGADGLPGTLDDQYALDPWPELRLGVGAALAPGLLRATTNPAVPGKILVDGVPRDEWGLNWVKLPSGPYTVSFGDVIGLGTPPPQAISVSPGMTTEVTGTYVRYASLRVTTDPALPATIYFDGEPRNDWGVWVAIPAGTYTISYGLVAGFTPPASEVVTLGPGEFRHVIGRYTSNPSAPGPDPATFGYLRVTTNPALASTIHVNGLPRNDWGLEWVKMAPGAYTVSFTGVYGATTPPSASLSIVAGVTTTHEGLFAVHGSLRVTTSGAPAPTVFVDGIPRDDWGMWQSMPPGTYTVAYQDIPGYTTPAADVVTVSAGALASADGTYTPSSAAEPASEPTVRPEASTSSESRIAVVLGREVA